MWIFGIAVIATVSIAIFASRKESSPAGENKSSPRAKTSSSEQVSSAKRKPAVKAESVTNEPPVGPEPPKEVWLGQPVMKHEYKTNNTLVVETIYTADGKKHKYYHDERENALPTGADQMLAMMTAHNGFGAPPLPQMNNFENDFADALKLSIEIAPTDSKETKELKERVIAARKEMLDLMAEGFSANDVIKDWEKMQEADVSVRLDAVRKVKEFLKEGDRESAQILCDEYNKVLKRAGIMKIELPPEK